MTGVMAHLREALDDLRHPRQRPQIGAEAVPLRPSQQGPLDPCQLPGVEPRFSAPPPSIPAGPAGATGDTTDARSAASPRVAA